MVRIPLTSTERERGRRLGQLLRDARGEESMVEIAARAGLSAETVRIGRQKMYRIKVLTPDGRVRVVQIPAAGR